MSPPYIVEIVTFTGSAAYLADRSILRAGAEFLLATAGVISVHHGVQVEDAQTAYLIVVWETYEAHVALVAGPTYDALKDTLRPAIGGSLALVHAKFPADPAGALTAPVTELAVANVREGYTAEFAGALFESITGAAASLAQAPGTWGPTVEDASLVAIIGWKSVKEHNQTVSNSSEAKEILGGILEATSLKLVHVALKKE